ncbi:hypothetical protein JCM3263A_15060 [Thermobifida fusca]|jgi:hypothetical protein|uniref:Uncharacterized protein n=1 Tax=Thermobifida fusca TM51 TaxID=1169414 RepID=A0A9P2TCF9_THEFU|nr:hypothetical protein [Thermobifida fusca]EOR72669.1 hypothetical protein TM51_01378 [Thermobifida fusca TM51]MDD6791054.1 hypothetical protein [Thermobifida fusca]PPS94007.1 hypothetical protein BH05_06460 [Thermobifida fusca]PZN61542.1 MAG: hypothetical protein DIU53_12805 [Thermobifida fusca]QOS59807.1 hypothetical protein IM867_05320 [Thermobifida fusca]
MRARQVLRREGDTPRRHHHEFTNVVLRAITFHLGPRFFTLARDRQLAEGLRGAWQRTGDALPAEQRLSSAGLTTIFTVRGTLEAAVVVLPQPMRPGEAYLVCGIRDNDPFHGPGDPDFYVLEADRTFRGSSTEPRTRLIRWTRDGRSLDLGEGPLPEVGAMLDAIIRVMSIGS